MALLAVGTGLWKDFSPIDRIHQVQAVAQPDLSRREVYENLLPMFAQTSRYQSRLGDLLAKVKN